jgi:hypothetical protein
MIDKDKFEFIKQKYGYLSSWAIWADEDEKPKSNVGDLSVFEKENVCTLLNPNIILVGLNISRGCIKYPLANFHDARPEATDYKIRYAFRDMPFSGAYMTDIIKDFDQKSSGKVATYLQNNKAFEEHNINLFIEELEDLGVTEPTIIAFGNEVHSILNRNFKNKYQILKVPHYANYSSKETYREEVRQISC